MPKTYFNAGEISHMGKIRQAYRRLDEWMWGLSRGKYALLIGFTAALGVLAVGIVFKEINQFFAVGIGLTLGILNYIFNPNQRDEE